MSRQRDQMFPGNTGMRMHCGRVTRAVVIDHGVVRRIRHFHAHSRTRAPAAAVHLKCERKGRAVFHGDTADDRASVLGRHDVEIRGAEDRLGRRPSHHLIGGNQTSAGKAEIALTAIEGFLGFLKVLPLPVSAVEIWMDLLRRQPVTGADIFDLQLVAVMLANKVKCIYTYNGSDFQPFPELIVKEP